MKRLLIGLCACLITNIAMAKPVKNIERAIDLVEKSIIKNKLTTLKRECLSFDDNVDNHDAYYEIDVREIHNEQCGGDPEISPRLFSYKVYKQTGKLCTDSYEWAIKLNAEDPTDFSCRPIK